MDHNILYRCAMKNYSVDWTTGLTETTSGGERNSNVQS